MRYIKLKFKTLEDVRNFVKIANDFSITGNIVSEDRTYSVSMNSIIGIFSLNLSNAVFLEVADVKDTGLFVDAIKNYIE